ncbi:TPA: hypothetical protein N0F65_000410, partial [Lagenidium giganteum]
PNRRTKLIGAKFVPQTAITTPCATFDLFANHLLAGRLHMASKTPRLLESPGGTREPTNQVDPPRLRFTRLMKRSAKETVLTGMKPNRIRYELFDEFHVNPDIMPPPRTIQAFVANVKISELKETDTVEDLEDFVRSHRFSGLTLEDEPFVLPDPWVGDDTTAKPIIIGLTNRKLLQTLQLATEYPLHVDATYNLNKKGLPVIAVGISDAARSYHLIAVFLTSHQTQRHFVNVFCSLQVGYARLGVGALKVKAVMADADKAQYNAVHEVFGRDVKQLMCIYHVIANDKKNAPEKGVPKSRMHDLLSAIYDIHYTFTRAEFESVKTRTLQRWREVPSMHAFTQYFVVEWLGNRFSRRQFFSWLRKNKQSRRNLAHLSVLKKQPMKIVARPAAIQRRTRVAFKTLCIHVLQELGGKARIKDEAIRMMRQAINASSVPNSELGPRLMVLFSRLRGTISS